MKSETRRNLLRTIARTAVATAIGAVTAKLAFRKRPAEDDDGYCDRAGRCGGCPVTDDCDVYEAIGRGSSR